MRNCTPDAKLETELISEVSCWVCNAREIQLRSGVPNCASENSADALHVGTEKPETHSAYDDDYDADESLLKPRGIRILRAKLEILSPSRA